MISICINFPDGIPLKIHIKIPLNSDKILTDYEDGVCNYLQSLKKDKGLDAFNYYYRMGEHYSRCSEGEE